MTALAHGWVVSAERFKGNQQNPRQFLVASEDRDFALSTVREIVDPGTKLAIQTSVEGSHLLRRGMQAGDVMELGGHYAPSRQQKAKKAKS